MECKRRHPDLEMRCHVQGTVGQPAGLPRTVQTVRVGMCVSAMARVKVLQRGWARGWGGCEIKTGGEEIKRNPVWQFPWQLFAQIIGRQAECCVRTAWGVPWQVSQLFCDGNRRMGAISLYKVPLLDRPPVTLCHSDGASAVIVTVFNWPGNVNLGEPPQMKQGEGKWATVEERRSDGRFHEGRWYPRCYFPCLSPGPFCFSVQILLQIK